MCESTTNDTTVNIVAFESRADDLMRIHLTESPTVDILLTHGSEPVLFSCGSCISWFHFCRANPPRKTRKTRKGKAVDPGAHVLDLMGIQLIDRITHGSDPSYSRPRTGSFFVWFVYFVVPFPFTVPPRARGWERPLLLLRLSVIRLRTRSGRLRGNRDCFEVVVGHAIDE